MSEQVIQFLIAMFVLSQISERISNFLKMYLPEWLLAGLRDKQDDPKAEKIRESKILLVSWVAGIITVLMFKQTLLALGTESGVPKVFRDAVDDGWFLFGISIFLSFGAKFWHDVLDIVFLYKNAQRVIRSGETALADSPVQINEMLKQSSVFISRRALNDNRKALMAHPGVISVGIGVSANKEPSLRVYFEDSASANKMNSEVLWTDDLGIVRVISIEKIVSGPAQEQSAAVGGKISNRYDPDRFGTMGFVFKHKLVKNTYYASSCYHVVRMRHHEWASFRSSDPDSAICHVDKGNPCGEVSKMFIGFRNDKLDIAIAQLDSLDSVDLRSLPRVSRSAKVDEKYANKEVIIKTQRGLVIGYIQDWQTSVVVRYRDGSSEEFHDFFSIRAFESSEPEDLRRATEGGDSGSAVYSAGEALGIIVGATDRLSYAMKVPVIEDHLGVTLLTNPFHK